MNANEPIHPLGRWSTVTSILMILAGLVAIIVPAAFGLAFTLLFGWLLVIGGAAHFMYAWHTHHGGGLWWGILMGVIYIGVGVYMLMHPVAALASLTIVLAAYLFVEALLEFVLAFFLRRMKGSWWLLFDGIITFILAVLILRTWPTSFAWVIGTLIGISILFSGITRLMFSLDSHRAAKSA